MTVAVKNNQPVIVPGSALRRAGFKRGQELEVMAPDGAIAIVPKLPDAAGEFTPEQRSVIDARLAEARKGPYHGPFASAKEAIAFMRAEVTARRPKPGSRTAI